MKFKLGDHIQQIPTAHPPYPSLGYGVITGFSEYAYGFSEHPYGFSEYAYGFSEHPYGFSEYAYLIKINDYNGGERWCSASDIDSCYVLYDSPEGVFYRL